MAMTKSEFERRLVDAVEQMAGNGVGAYSETYLFQAQDLGAANVTEVIRGPAGKIGIVRSVSVFNVTEAYNSVTTASRVEFGNGSDADYYAETADFSDIAIAGAESPAISAGVGGNALPGDTDITVTMYAPTGGTPTGISDVQFVITWY
jgi:hypothetical protein